MGNLAPTSKMTATGTAGAASLVLIWILGQFGVDMPAEVAAGFAVLLAWAAGYIKTERAAAKPKGRYRAGK